MAKPDCSKPSREDGLNLRLEPHPLWVSLVRFLLNTREIAAIYRYSGRIRQNSPLQTRWRSGVNSNPRYNSLSRLHLTLFNMGYDVVWLVNGSVTDLGHLGRFDENLAAPAIIACSAWSPILTARKADVHLLSHRTYSCATYTSFTFC